MKLIQRHRVISSRITPFSHPHWFSPTFLFSSLRSIGGTGRSIGVSGRTVQAADTIPDSVVVQHTASDFSTGNTSVEDDTDTDGTQPLSLHGDPQAATLSDGSDSIDFDAADDHGAVNLPSEFEGTGLNAFSLELAVQFDSTERTWGIANNDGQLLTIGFNTNTNFDHSRGNIRFRLRDQDSTEVHFVPNGGASLADNTRHNISFIINDATNNDAELIIDGINTAIAFGEATNPDNFNQWEDNLFYNAFNNLANNTVVANQGTNVGAVRWHDSAITEQTINNYPS